MHLVTNNAAPAAFPALPAKARPVSRMVGEANGLPWMIFELDFEYGFAVGGAAQYVAAAEHETAPKAEKAAKRWCAAYVAEPVFVEPALEVVSADDFDEAVFGQADTPPAPVINPLGEHEIAGWRIVVSEGRAGTYKAEVFDGEVRGALDQNFTGYETAKLALGDAALWAMQHPCDVLAVVFDDCAPVGEGHFIHDDGEEPEGGGGLSEDGAAEQRVDKRRPPDATVGGWLIFVVPGRHLGFDVVLIDAFTGAECDAFHGHGDTHDDALVQATKWAEDHQATDVAQNYELSPGDRSDVAALLAEVEQLRRERDMAIAARQASEQGMVADFGEAAAKAEQRRLLRVERQRLAAEQQDIKDRLKVIDADLEMLATEGLGLVEAIGNGLRPKAYQQRLTFDQSSAVRASVGAQAEQVAGVLGGRSFNNPVGVVWAFNGVEHVIETSHESMPDGPRWTAWIRGHRATTEGYHEDEALAIEACKNAASVIFGDCDPGETSPSVDPAVRLPPRRGRKPKLGGHDLDAVKAALAGGILDAAMTLGVTPQKLEQFAEKHGLAAGLPAAPQEAAPVTRRGRKGGAK